MSLDNKVRHVGDRVAIVAAETPELVQQALELIDVTLRGACPPCLTPQEAMADGAPVIHDEADAVDIHDAARNIAVHIGVEHTDDELGNVDDALANAHFVYESEYSVHQVQQASIEPHVVLSWWDEDDRLVLRTSTQVPFHVRRMVAPLIGLPPRRIRVVKPRIGGGFGGKQEMLLEDLCAHLTIATGRPVRFEYTRAQEFTSARTRHPQVLRYRSGVDKHGKLVGTELRIVADTGAYGTHGLTVQMVSGFRGLSTYWLPTARFDCDVVYTNKPVPGAFRGYGAPQALFGLEQHMEELAEAFGMDPIAFKRLNWVKEGQELAAGAGHGRGPRRLRADSAQQRAGRLHGSRRRGHRLGAQVRPRLARRSRRDPHVRRGLGVAVCMHGTGIAGLDMGAASIKLNDDGSFNLLIGATDLGTGSDTVLAQIAAEALGVDLEHIIVYSSDTDFTPFDTGAYASSTTYISGGAVLKAAEDVQRQIVSAHGQTSAAGRGRRPAVAGGRPCACAGWTHGLAGDGCPAQPAPGRAAPDHGHGQPHELSQPAALCRPVRRGGGGHGNRTGDRGEAGHGRGLRHRHQPGHGQRPGGGRHGAGAGLRRSARRWSTTRRGGW